MAAEPVYYNEFNKDAAAWLRNLINAGHIAHGIVDERSIEDVFPSDLRGFKQCHFFAGIGVWSYALRSAGWSDDRPIWTGSCPCQPFSAAGQGAGFDDERHLWPHFHHLIKQCNPPTVVGEQVASKDADPWIDLVQTDLEALGYAFGAVPFPSAGIGAPHIRDRLYWVANANGARSLPSPYTGVHSREDGAGTRHGESERPRATGGMEHPRHNHDAGQSEAASVGQPQANRPANIVGGSGVSFGGLADDQLQQRPGGQSRIGPEYDALGWIESAAAPAGLCGDLRSGPTNGLWRNADWLLCRDGRWRPVEPGTFPLVDGPAARLGRVRTDWHSPAGPEGFGHRGARLKGYGNAINAEAARTFIQVVMESL